jgi:hypothetical protein
MSCKDLQYNFQPPLFTEIVFAGFLGIEMWAVFILGDWKCKKIQRATFSKRQKKYLGVVGNGRRGILTVDMGSLDF